MTESWDGTEIIRKTSGNPRPILSDGAPPVEELKLMAEERQPQQHQNRNPAPFFTSFSQILALMAKQLLMMKALWQKNKYYVIYFILYYSTYQKKAVRYRESKEKQFFVNR